MSAFFMFVISGTNVAYALDQCKLSSSVSAEKAKVKWVYDGDTLLVTDLKGKNRRKIRLIGIDTPEVKHHQQKAQVYGAKAREALRALLKEANYQVLLTFDKEKRDRYKRSLAYVYFSNGNSISAWLLQQGFAKTLVIPPNVKHAHCYKNIERQAQQQKRRLWKLTSNQIKAATDLESKTAGYVRLKGKILRIKQQKKSIVLDLESNSKKPIQLKINKKNLQYFKGLSIEKLIAQEVIVSGILKNSRGKRRITLKHATQLEWVSASNTEKSVIEPTIKWSTKK